MQKVYLLLRNNSQTGPFNLDELLQFDLKPFDLIWIEGKSAGWYYPQEIEALRPHLPFLRKAETQTAPTQNGFVKTEPSAPRKIFVSMPSSAAAKEEPIRQQTQPRPAIKFEEKPSSFASSTQPEPEVRTNYAKSIEEVETDYTNWAYQKKANKKPIFSKTGLVVLCLLGAGLFAVGKYANRPKTEDAPAPQQTALVTTPGLTNAEEQSEAKPASQKTTVLGGSTKKEKAKKSFAETKDAASVFLRSPKNTPADVVTKSPVKEEGANQSAPAAKAETPAEEKSEPTAASEAPKEKKTLGDKIRDIFKRKSDDKKEEAKPTEEENGRRQSTRRESGSSLAQLVKVSFDVPNSWMMGIKGAKATLSNRSSETLVKAVIEVRYYNDDNELLDKKNIAFSNVKSKQSQTVPVPEHNTATRLEYSVISAVGNEPVARL